MWTYGPLDTQLIKMSLKYMEIVARVESSERLKGVFRGSAMAGRGRGGQ